MVATDSVVGKKDIYTKRRYDMQVKFQHYFLVSLILSVVCVHIHAMEDDSKEYKVAYSDDKKQIVRLLWVKPLVWPSSSMTEHLFIDYYVGGRDTPMTYVVPTCLPTSGRNPEKVELSYNEHGFFVYNPSASFNDTKSPDYTVCEMHVNIPTHVETLPRYAIFQQPDWVFPWVAKLVLNELAPTIDKRPSLFHFSLRRSTRVSEKESLCTILQQETAPSLMRITEHSYVVPGSSKLETREGGLFDPFAKIDHDKSQSHVSKDHAWCPWIPHDFLTIRED
jgi:hypothetical protein